MSAPGAPTAIAERSPLRFVAYLLAAAAVVLAAALGAGASHDVVLQSPPGGGNERASWQRPEGYSEEEWGNSEEEKREVRESAGAPVSLMVALIVVTAIPLVLLGVMIARRLARQRLPQLSTAGRAAAGPLFTVEEAADSVRAAREQLRSVVGAQDAVVAAWLELERAVAASGVRREPAQTTQEYVTSVLARVDLDPALLSRFAELYRRALFDARPLEDADRDAALELLDALAEQLEAPDRERAR